MLRTRSILQKPFYKTIIIKGRGRRGNLRFPFEPSSIPRFARRLTLKEDVYIQRMLRTRSILQKPFYKTIIIKGRGRRGNLRFPFEPSSIPRFARRLTLKEDVYIQRMLRTRSILQKPFYKTIIIKGRGRRGNLRFPYLQ